MIPEAQWLLERERRSRRQGSGLSEAALIGSWRLERIWSKGSLRPAAFGAALLRGLAARLQLAPDHGEEGGETMRMVNSVRLGALELRFDGVGRLQGRRPLLVFSFDRLRLLLGGRVLIERALPPPDPLRRPFFALIAANLPGPGEPDPATGTSQGWLAARGRGGGLALWRLEAGEETK
ncbi:hypothetical protein [Cyanobium gracile]|uniref:Plastid lipid-associated protein/fibrillin conserved domain-containing protein n=1 Tax=Cyanobium gracile UHCC 0281 TaxID=3110309 RepID=A0ABU5SVX8_9CYAN|nr:hypothetical protein [Cyanobium gracile]MEA5442616.1 hypothetical protein [Cyanobium gracile UHCC 0281]